MHDVEPLAVVGTRLVGRMQPVERLRKQAQDYARGHSPLFAHRFALKLSERRAPDEVHNQEKFGSACRVFLDHVQDRNNVWMVDPRGEPYLVHEHGEDGRICRRLRVQLLHGNRLRKSGRASHLREMHAGHATSADLAAHPVAAHGVVGADFDLGRSSGRHEASPPPLTTAALQVRAPAQMGLGNVGERKVIVEGPPSRAIGGGGMFAFSGGLA